MARLQTVDKASQSFLPAGKKSVQSFSPAACTSAKILLAQRVSICALPAHMRHGSERKPSRRQSQKDFVDDLRPGLHGPAFALPGTDVPPWLPSAPTVLFCDAAKERLPLIRSAHKKPPLCKGRWQKEVRYPLFLSVTYSKAPLLKGSCQRS